MRLNSRTMTRSMSSAGFVNNVYELLKETEAKNAKVEEVNKAWLEKENSLNIPRQFYKHPYCTEEYPLSTNPDHTMRIMMEILGPEMVSPHYQSIMEFGKWYNYFFIGVIFTLAMRDHHNHAFGYVVFNLQYGFEMWIYVYFYYFMQSTGVMFPNAWKDLWKTYNLTSMVDSVYELEENLAFKFRKPSVDQIDYHRAYQEFLGTKAKILEAHMKNAKLQLKKHTYERALTVLRATERFERDNLSNSMKKVLEEAMDRLNKDINGALAKEIRKEAFKSALIGIRKGKMTYENDPLLPRLVGYIEEFRAKAEKMSEQEQAKILGLTKEQKAVLASADSKAEENFIKALPNIKHPRILANPQFKTLSA